MTRRFGFSTSVLLVLAIGGATLTVAQDQPSHLRPARDVEVEYRNTMSTSPPSAGIPAPYPSMSTTQRFYMRAGGELVRGDIPDLGVNLHMGGALAGGYIVLDFRQHRMIEVFPRRHMYSEAALEGSAQTDALPPDDGDYTRSGSDVVAGQPCTVWSVRVAGESAGTVCLTDEGLMLRNEGSTKAAGLDAHIVMEAVSVKYDPLPDALFEPPPGYSKQEILSSPPTPPRGARRPSR